MKESLKNKFFSLLLFILFLIVWEGVSKTPRMLFLFGSPSSIWSKIVEYTQNMQLPYDMAVTGYEALAGFIIGITLGTFIGFLLWYSSRIAEIVKPYIVILGAIPVFAFAPIIIIWFGIDIGMKIAMAAIGTFLVALVQAYEGAKSIDEEEYKLLKIYGATRFQMLQKVIFPASLSWVLASMKLNVGYAILGAFVGEFISSSAGLGHFMIRSGSLYDIPSVFAGGFYLVVLSLIFFGLVRVVERNRLKIIDFFA